MGTLQKLGSRVGEGLIPSLSHQAAEREHGLPLATSQTHLLLMITVARRRKMEDTRKDMKGKELDQIEMQSQEKYRERRGH